MFIVCLNIQFYSCFSDLCIYYQHFVDETFQQDSGSESEAEESGSEESGSDKVTNYNYQDKDKDGDDDEDKKCLPH